MFATHGLQEVLRRLTLYAEAGADLLFADALVSERDIATVARHVAKPLCVNMGSDPHARHHPSSLHRRAYRRSASPW